MPKETKKAETQTELPESWEDAVASAKEMPDLFPKLKFGENKLAEVTIDVQIMEDQPRVIEYDDAFNGGAKAKAYAINVRVLSGPEAGSMRALIMSRDPNHGLTRGILNLAKKGGLRLKDRAVRIETRNYDHKTFGNTRGFTVSEIDPPASPAP